MKQYCLTLNLRDDEALITEYEERHLRVWPEVLESLRAAGITSMQIYRHATTLVMIMQTDDSFSFERKAQLDRANPLVMQWEREMAKYQAADPAADAGTKWMPMHAIFDMEQQSRPGSSAKMLQV